MFNNQFTPISGIQSPDNINVFDRSSTPTLAMGSKVNDLWFNTTTNPGVWYQCTSISPLTCTAASGSSGNLTGDITSVGTVTTVAAIQGVTVSGTTGTGSVVFSGTPTISTPYITNPTIEDKIDNSKQLLFSLSGATTGKTVTLSSSHTNNRTWTLQDATDTFVGLATTDTLTNKTLTSPTLTTPVLGTPASGNLSNCTNIPVNQATGNLSVSHLNSGTNADSSHYWRGDGTWATVSSLPSGSAYQILNADSSGTYYYPSRGWLSASTGDRCDFTSASSPQYGTNTASSGSTSINQFGGSSPSTGQGFGWIKLTGNGNATGEASAFFPNGNCFALTGGQITLEASLYVTALSTGTNRYKLTFGLGDTNLSSTIGTYCIIQYTDNVNSGQWEVISRSGGTTNTVTTSVAPAANTVYRLKCVINAAGTSASFYYATASTTDTLIGTTNADLPTSTQLYFFVDMQETVGTSTPTCWLDYMQYEQQFTTLR